MAGEKKNTTDTQSSDAFAMLTQLLAGGGTMTAQNSVYLGTKPGLPPSVIAKPGAKATKIPDITTIQKANALYLNDPKLQASWRKSMQKNGLETGNPLLERRAWETAVAGASDWYATSNGTAKVTPEQYLQWWAGGQKGKSKPKPDLTRSIYQYSPEQLGAKIDEVAQSLLGRTITDTDKQADWYSDLNNALNKMVQKGTVSTTKQVRNPKTGKLELVSTQKPEVTTEAITQKITSALETADPESLERKKRIDFTSWLFGQMGGRG